MKVIKKFLPIWIGLITLLILFIIYIIMGYAPFGGNSLARSDANVQYIDFFAYLKEILSGNASVGYTFDKVLGGNNIGIISYYLLSPFNILVILFDKTDLHNFIDIIAALKIGLAACTMSFFLKERFIGKNQNTSKQKYLFIGLLGISYALSQWFISQSSNIMWLDGAYMLPLILLGIYKLVQKKKIWVLSLTVGLSIIFNWYSGGINCIFSFIWLIFEIYNQYIEPNRKIDWRHIIKVFLRYIIAMLLALAISAIVLLPTIEVMGGTSRGQLEFSSLFNLNFRGNVLSSMQTYSLGATSSESAATIFCGSLALIGVIGCFLTKRFSSHKKVAYAILLTIIILSFYWNPEFMLFSLLKSADSFWYRYGYIAIFTIIFMATDFFVNGNYSKLKKSSFFIISFSYSIALLLLNYINPSLTNIQHVYCSIIFMFLIITTLAAIKEKTIKYIFLALLVLAELICSTILQMNKFHTEDVYTFQEYTLSTEKQIDEIKAQDKDYYRISQTATRNQTTDNLTANYNEPLAYNYWSISGYTSNPDENQMTFLDKVGYLTGSVNMNIIDTSLLGIDSLLGVKYILSPYRVSGLQETNFSTGYHDKKVYRNPYALPIAFTYQNNDYDLETEQWTGMNSINPFEYQNRIFKKLSNTNINIYKPITSHTTKGDQRLTYTLDIPCNNCAIYANIPWQNPIPSKINLNNTYEMGYSMWLSPSALLVPTETGDTRATISIQTSDPNNFKLGEEQFYALDLNKLQSIYDMLSDNSPETSIIKDNYIYFEVTANQDEYLFTSIPKDKNWSIKLNGQEINPDLFADVFYTIQLSQGNNKIEMIYNTKSIAPGIFLTLIGIVTISVIGIYETQSKKYRHS